MTPHETRDTKATCESHRHIYGVGGRCVFCRTRRAEDSESRHRADDAQTITTLQDENARLIQEREVCAEFLRAGETPAECIARNRADTHAVMTLLATEKSENEALRDELAVLRAEVEQRLKGKPDCLGVVDALTMRTTEVDVYAGWLLEVRQAAQRCFGDDAQRVDGPGFAAWLEEQVARLKADRHDWRCTCPSCMPLALPGPQPSEDDINKLEGVAWDANVDKTLIWYRDTIDMLRQRLRETERAAQIDAKARQAELATLKADVERREQCAVDLLERVVSHLGFWEGIRADIIAYLTQRQEPTKP